MEYMPKSAQLIENTPYMPKSAEPIVSPLSRIMSFAGQGAENALRSNIVPGNPSYINESMTRNPTDTLSKMALALGITQAPIGTVLGYLARKGMETPQGQALTTKTQDISSRIPDIGMSSEPTINAISTLGRLARILPKEQFAELPKTAVEGLVFMGGNLIDRPLIEGLKNIPTELSKVVSSGRDYGANKANAIKESFWNSYAPKEWNAYGKAIEDLPNSGTGSIKGDTFIQNLEKNLVDRGLISPEGVRQTTGISLADSKLLKAYDNVQKIWADSPNGELNMTDIVNEYKNLKGKFTSKPTPIQRQNIEAANTFFNSASDQINNEAFSTAKSRYRTFKENQQLIDKAIGLYRPNIETARGERFLTKGALSKTTQGRLTGKMITDKTGQSLKGAKILTLGNKMNPLNWIKR